MHNMKTPCLCRALIFALTLHTLFCHILFMLYQDDNRLFFSRLHIISPGSLELCALTMKNDNVTCFLYIFVILDFMLHSAMLVKLAWNRFLHMEILSLLDMAHGWYILPSFIYGNTVSPFPMAHWVKALWQSCHSPLGNNISWWHLSPTILSIFFMMWHPCHLDPTG